MSNYKDIEKRRKTMLAHYHRNREKYIVMQREYRRRIKKMCYIAYGGYICNCCGITEPSMLCLDHIENDGYQNRKEIGYKGGIGIYLWLVRNQFPPGFQVLCYNCNQSKRVNNGTCFHKLVVN